MISENQAETYCKNDDGRISRRRSRGGASGALIASALFVLLPCASAQEPPPQAQGDDPRKATAPLSDVPAMRAPQAEPAGVLADSPRVRELYAAALEAFEDGKLQRSIIKLDGALSVAEQYYYEVFLLLAQAKFRTQRFGEARTAAEFAVRLRRGAADAHYLLGRIFRRRSDLERAIGHFRSATLAAEREVNNANISAAFFELGECLVEAGYPLAAAQSFQAFDERIWDSHADHRSHARIAVALTRYPRGMIGVRMELLGNLGRTDDLLRAAQWAASSRPDDDYLRRVHIRALLDAGRDADAFDACRAALKSAEGNASYVRLAIEAARGANKLDYWIDELGASVTDARDGGLPAAVARQLDDGGAAAQAVKLRQALATARPQDSARAWALAGSLRAAGRLRETVQTLVDFVRANPQATDVPRAQFAAWMRHFEAADDLLTLIDTFSKGAKSDFASDFILGSLAAAAGHDTLAEKLLASCLARRASFVPARVAWGEMLLSSYRWEDARAQAQAALKSSPKHAGAHFLMARARSGLDENDAAEESFEAALRYAAGEAEFALVFARHHWRLHEWVRSRSGAERDHRLAAQRYYGEAAALDPSDARAAEGLVSSYLRAEKLPIARSRLADAEKSGLADDALRRMRTMIDFFRRERSEGRLAELERQFERFPDDVSTGRKLAEMYAARQRVDDAHGLVERLRKSSPDDDDLMRLAARVHVWRLEYEQAAALLEEQVRRYPRRRSALIELAELYHNDLRMDEARATLTRVLALDLDDRERGRYRLALVATWYQVRDFDAALTYLDEWIADEPKNETAFRVRLNVLLFAGRHDEAVRASRVSGDAAPDNNQRKARLWWFADLCRDVGKHKLAVAAYRELIDEGLSTLQLVLDLAKALLRDGRPDEALRVLNDPMQPAAGANYQIQWLRAQCDAKAGRVDAATNDLESLLEQPALKASRAKLLATRQILIVILAGERRFDRAIELCDAWTAESDDRDVRLKVGLLGLRSSVLHSAGRMDAYVQVMEQWLELAPQDVGVNNDLGYTWVDRGEHLEQATRMIRKAVAAAPLNTNFLDSLGWAYYKAEDFSLARKYLRRSLRVLEGEDPVVRDHLGDVDYRLGDVDSARKNWQKSLDLIEAETDDSPEPGRAELTASSRAKLKALEDGNEPDAAPLGGGER